MHVQVDSDLHMKPWCCRQDTDRDCDCQCPLKYYWLSLFWFPGVSNLCVASSLKVIKKSSLTNSGWTHQLWGVMVFISCTLSLCWLRCDDEEWLKTDSWCWHDMVRYFLLICQMHIHVAVSPTMSHTWWLGHWHSSSPLPLCLWSQSERWRVILREAGELWP